MKYLFYQWLISLRHYLRMCLFLSSPASLPYSPASIIFSLFAYILVGERLLGEMNSLPVIIAQIMTEVLILFAISFFVLRLTKKPERILQTLSALIGVSLIVSLTSLLLLSLLPESQDPEQASSLVIQVSALLLIWNLAVISLIFKRAFEIHTMLAAFIAFNYFIFYQYLVLNYL